MASPEGRARMDALAQSQEGSIRPLANWRAYLLVETFTDEYKRFVGRDVRRDRPGAGHDAVGHAVRHRAWPTI